MRERYEVRRIGDGRKLWRHPAVGFGLSLDRAGEPGLDQLTLRGGE
jgi:hypothetical protein